MKSCDSFRPFRRLDARGDLCWEKISSLDKGHIYKQVGVTTAAGCRGGAVLLFSSDSSSPAFQGNLFDFLRLTGWRGSKVLYFGDHLYSDLAVSYCSRCVTAEVSTATAATATLRTGTLL